MTVKRKANSTKNTAIKQDRDREKGRDRDRQRVTETAATLAIKAAYAFYDSINFKFSIRVAAVFQNYFRHFFSSLSSSSISYACVCVCVCVTWRLLLLLINATPPSLEGCSQTVSAAREAAPRRAECLKCSAIGFSLFFLFFSFFLTLLFYLKI